MKTKIAAIEKTIKERDVNPASTGTNHTLLWAYRKSHEAGNNMKWFNVLVSAV